MTIPLPTIDQLLSEHQNGNWAAALSGLENGELFTRLTRAVPGLGSANATGAFKTIAGTIPDLLHVDVGAVFVGGWKKVADLQRYADGTKYGPDQTILVKLGQHTVTSSHKPHLDIVVDGVKVDSVPFDISLTLTLDTAILTIRNGEILGVSLGTCKVAGEFKCEGYSILKRESAPVPLPGTWTFSEPIRIRD